jgi:HPt (histidine-containing phosphotransfer) domain-containing protein
MAQPVDVSSLVMLRQLQKPGRPDAVSRIIARFLEESAARLESLRLAVRDGDAQALERAAHALKGITGTVGAHEMHDIALQLERLGREGQTSGAGDLLTALDASFARSRPLLTALQTTT